MNLLIDNLITLTNAAIDIGDINIMNIAHCDIYKGLSSVPDDLMRDVYIAYDDGGERIEDTDSNMAQLRYYSIIMEYGVFVLNRDMAFDNCINLGKQIKKMLESQTTKTSLQGLNFDGHIWGISITPYEVETQDQRFYKIRQVIVDFYKLEDRIFEY